MTVELTLIVLGSIKVATKERPYEAERCLAGCLG